MSHRDLSSAQFRGVLHGYDVNDDPATPFSAPYEVGSREEVEHYKRRLASIRMRPTSSSHEGTCEQAGCRFTDHDSDAGGRDYSEPDPFSPRRGA